MFHPLCPGINLRRRKSDAARSSEFSTKSLGKGEGVRQDYSAAVRWFRQAAEQGVAAAQNDLGVMYASGKGVPKNVILAYMWASLSFVRDNTISSAFRDLLAREMTPAQIAEAQKLAREWKPTHTPRHL
jgi:uncharacterized protein